MAKKKAPHTLRPVTIQRGFTEHPEGSVLIRQGETRVMCTASVEERVPDFLRERGGGWVTAEYSMLPRSTHTRSTRESVKGRLGGRTMEISRLIGRSLRGAVDLAALDGFTVTIDCDVLQADGGTRCASITGGMVALYDALRWLHKQKALPAIPLRHFVAAVSVGIVEKTPTLDLCYAEDSRADVDMNFVMTEDGKYLELQGTAEQEPFSDRQLSQMKKLAANGITQLVALQKKALGIS